MSCFCSGRRSGSSEASGNITEPVAFWTFVVNQGLITLVVALGGWLLVRGRHPLAFIVLLIVVIPPIVSRILVDVSATSGSCTLVTEAMVIFFGIDGAWLAALIDRLVRRRSAALTAPTAEAAPADYPVSP